MDIKLFHSYCSSTYGISVFDLKGLLYSLTNVPSERQKILGLVKGKLPPDGSFNMFQCDVNVTYHFYSVVIDLSDPETEKADEVHPPPRTSRAAQSKPPVPGR